MQYNAFMNIYEHFIHNVCILLLYDILYLYINNNLVFIPRARSFWSHYTV